MSDMGRPFTVDDLDFMPDDGNVYELIDGSLIVSPTPGRRHQRALDRVVSLLDSACPNELLVLWPPCVVQPDDWTELRPDAQVAWADDLDGDVVVDAPVLVVEIVAPSTAITDLHNKKAAYERMGVPHYWLLDPARPSLVAYRLAEGRYREVTTVCAEEEFATSDPFPLRIVLTELLGRPAS
jgi:Uma2 family endonuclease